LIERRYGGSLAAAAFDQLHRGHVEDEPPLLAMKPA
jgi:hypothetical protein